MKSGLLRNVLRWHWRLLPQHSRTWLVDRYDDSYLYFHILNDWRYERRLNIQTGWDHTFSESEATQSELRDPSRIQSTPYAFLERLRNYLNPGPEDSFLDVGCATGRVAIFMAASQLGRSRGIDFDARAVEIAQQNLAHARIDRNKVSFSREDAASYRFDDETIIFFSNPFGPATMSRVLSSIERSLKNRRRELRICYYNPVCGHLLEDAPWLSKVDELTSLKKPIVIYRHVP